MSNVNKCVAIAEKISSGELSVSDGATAILNLVHDNRSEAQQSMADALWNAHKASLLTSNSRIRFE